MSNNNLDFFCTDMVFDFESLFLVSIPPRISSDGFDDQLRLSCAGYSMCAIHYQLITGQPLQARRRATISVNVHLIRLHLRTLGESMGLSSFGKSATFRQHRDSRFVPKCYFEPSTDSQENVLQETGTSSKRRFRDLGDNPSFDLSQGSHQAALEIFQIFLSNISNISRKKRIIHYKIISIETEI